MVHDLRQTLPRLPRCTSHFTGDFLPEDALVGLKTYLVCLDGSVGLITPTLKLDQFTESYPEAELQCLISGCMSRPQTGEYAPDDFIPIRAAIGKTKMDLFDVIYLLSGEKIHHLPPVTGRAKLGSLLINWRELRRQSGSHWPDGYVWRSVGRKHGAN